MDSIIEVCVLESIRLINDNIFYNLGINIIKQINYNFCNNSIKCIFYVCYWYEKLKKNRQMPMWHRKNIKFNLKNSR